MHGKKNFFFRTSRTALTIRVVVAAKSVPAVEYHNSFSLHTHCPLLRGLSVELRIVTLAYAKEGDSKVARLVLEAADGRKSCRGSLIRSFPRVPLSRGALHLSMRKVSPGQQECSNYSKGWFLVNSDACQKRSEIRYRCVQPHGDPYTSLSFFYRNGKLWNSF